MPEGARVTHKELAVAVAFAGASLSLSGGQAYTAFAAGYLTPDDEPADTAFDLVVAQDTQGMSG